MNERLSPERRREAFKLLVTAQDGDMSIKESRKMVMEMFGITREQLIQIEQEGIENGWPPLEGEK
jgi:hypothetical protein